MEGDFFGKKDIICFFKIPTKSSGYLVSSHKLFFFNSFIIGSLFPKDFIFTFGMSFSCTFRESMKGNNVIGCNALLPHEIRVVSCIM